MKKLFRATVVCAIAILFAACGSKDDDKEKKPASQVAAKVNST